MKKQLHQINPLVVVADAARARFLAMETASRQLSERSTLVNTQAQLRDQDLAADGHGRSFDSNGSGRHAMEPSTNPKTNAMHTFAEDVARQVVAELSELDAHQLVLVAAPKFLGVLRKALPEKAKEAVYFEIDGDFTMRRADEIAEMVNKRLSAAQ